MTTEEESHILRTSRSRMAKGIAVVVLVMAVGAGIQLGMGDYWHKFPPQNQIKVQAQPPPSSGGVQITGEKVEASLTFTESSDFRTLGFNGLPGDPNANKDIMAHVGDEIHIELKNGGKMPHAFAIVSDPDDPNTIAFKGSVFKSAANPIKSGESGEVKFIADKEGEFYYICTVPGHSTLGMKGKFIVKKAEGAGVATGESVKPTGISHTFDLAFVETADLRTLGFNAPMGEPNANPEIKVKAGDSVTINVVNNGKMPHAFAVVSSADEPLSTVFNAKVKSADNPILKGQNGTVTFIADRAGHYYYICAVPGHAALGMKGDFIVE
ncbi:MAG: plastocyanin/azurin family copper-binding protein [Nitrososphaerales archaeon]